MTTPPPSFGRRGLVGAPVAAAAAPSWQPHPTPPPPRRFRSEYVLLTAIGLFAVGAASEAHHRSPQCRDRTPGDPDPRPAWCDSWGGVSSPHVSSYGGRGIYGDEGSGFHARFGGFGGFGFGRGGAS